MKILVVCYGDLCRGPLAVGLLNKLFKEKNIDAVVDSAGFEPYNLNQGPDIRIRQLAEKHGIELCDHRSRLFSADDFDRFDKIYVMDQKNFRDVVFLARNEADKQKVDFIMNNLEPGKNKIVPDPNHGGELALERTFDKLHRCCREIADKVEQSLAL